MAQPGNNIDKITRILGDTNKKAPPNYKETINEEFNESLAIAIEKAGKSLGKIDCTDKAKEFIDSLTANKFTNISSGIEKLSESFNINSLLNWAGNQLAGGTPAGVDVICSTVPIVAKAIIEIIETVMKLAIKLFRKIDAMAKRLEAAIKFYLDEVRNCIMKIIKDIQLYVNTVVTNILDMDALSKIIDSPCGGCIRELLIYLFPCCKNKTTGTEFVECIKSIVSSAIGIDSFLDGFNQFLQEYVFKYLNGIFALLQKSIQYIFDSIMRPLRWLIKAYCRLLNMPLPAPFIGKPLHECLFVYSKDRKGKYTMSVLQYIETLKLWTKCFDSICGYLSSDLSDDLKKKLKEFNKELRLNVKYWLGGNGNELDIYWSCIETTHIAKDSDMKALWTSLTEDPFGDTWDFIKDSMISLSREKTQPLNSRKKVCPPISNTSSVSNIELTEQEDSTVYKDGIDPLSDAIRIVNGKDSEEFPIAQGHLRLYSDFVEQSIIKTIQNIRTVISNDNWWERLNEMTKWLNPYIKSSKLFNTLRSAKGGYGVDADDSTETETLGDFYSVLPTYIVRNEYSILNTIPAPEKLPGEPMIDYYARWYGATINQSSIA